MSAAPVLAVRRPRPIRVASGPIRAASAPATEAERVQGNTRRRGRHTGRTTIALACIATLVALAAIVVPGRGATRDPAAVRALEPSRVVVAADALDTGALDEDEAYHRVVQVDPDGGIGDAQRHAIDELVQAARRSGVVMAIEPCGQPGETEARRIRAVLAHAIDTAGGAAWVWSPLLGGCVLEGGVVLRLGG